MAKYQNKQTGAIVEANRISDPDFAQRQAGVEPGDWLVIGAEGTAVVKPADFADAFEYAPNQD